MKMTMIVCCQGSNQIPNSSEIESRFHPKDQLVFLNLFEYVKKNSNLELETS